MSHKYVYEFSEANGSMRYLLGGKGANLAEMTGLERPPERFLHQHRSLHPLLRRR